MTPRAVVSTRPFVGEVLSVHLDGKVCRVGCEFCYLGQRREAGEPQIGWHSLLEQALARLDYREVAVAVSEPAEEARPILQRIRGAVPRLSITTTLQIARSSGDLLDDADRVNLSVDPRKGRVSLGAIARVARRVRGEVVLIVSLVTPEFAAQVVDGGLLHALLELPDVDKVALNALKPPPPWCGRAFWMGALGRMRPLLDEHLDKKLFLDCWVAARLLGLGGCPARADLTPAAGGLAFRGCVYQPTPDFIVAGAGELAEKLAGFTPPAVCPFPIP
jgi:hypothetical protein